MILLFQTVHKTMKHFLLPKLPAIYEWNIMLSFMPVNFFQEHMIYIIRLVNCIHDRIIYGS